MSLHTLTPPPSSELAGQPPLPGEYALGRINPLETTHVFPETIGIDPQIAPREIVRVGVDDPYVEHLEAQRPGRVRELQARESSMSAYARYRRMDGGWVREPGTPYIDAEGVTHQKRFFEYGDLVSQAEFFGKGGPLDDEALRAWRSVIPHAYALLPLTNPTNIEMIVNRRGQPVEATELTRDWLTAGTDPWEIRNRGTILAEEVKEVIERHAEADPEGTITMVSVGAGTLLPTLQAAMHSGVDTKRVRIVMLENSKGSIDMAEYLADELGFKGEIVAKKIDVFDPAVMEATVTELEGQAATVDAVGLYEYINEELRGSKALQDKPEGYLLAEPIKFMQMIDRMVKPGGRLIIGQMRDDRPNPDFTMGVIGWPYVVMLPPAKLYDMVTEAGFGGSRTKLSLTPKGVYTMVSIDKPVPGIADRNVQGRVGSGALLGVTVPHQERRRGGLVERARGTAHAIGAVLAGHRTVTH